MFLEIGIFFIVLWLIGFLLYPLGGLIHILLVVAIICIIWHFVSRKKKS
jgi:hypothetical protein